MMGQRRNQDPLLTTHEVASILGAEPSSVIRWFDKGVLRGWRTPGGHRRIRASSVVSYLNAKGMEIPTELAEVPAGPAVRLPDLEPADDVGLLRLMWVDDNASFLLGIGRELRPHENRVRSLLLDNPIEALLELSRFRPHLVVFDLMMPEVNGIDACRTLKQRPEGNSMSIILVSAHGTDELRDEALAAGATAFLEKPVSLEVVLRHLEQAAGAAQRATA